jgi:hypothetical protein
MVREGHIFKKQAVFVPKKPSSKPGRLKESYLSSIVILRGKKHGDLGRGYV